MASFRTELQLFPSSSKIDHRSNLITLGSCFSNSIGQKLTESKFTCLANPFGTTFNPISILRQLKFAAQNVLPEKDSFLVSEGVWRNYHFHSSFFSPSKNDLEEKVKSTVQSVHDFLKTTDYLIITCGTAFIYERNDNNQIVANCHKQPTNQFTKRLLTVEEISESFKTMLEAIRKINPGCKVMLTVSPVRHLKDTLELNSVSKSILRIACHELIQSGVAYFPAYEFVLDDLRDYRFYESDMIHPNQQAIDYIWDKFSDQYFSEATLNFVNQWNDIKAALNHRPFNPEGEAHQKFLKQSISKLIELGKLVNTESEIEQLKSLTTKPKF